MEELVINPMSLVGMTTYHSRNVPSNVGVSYGLLYALQEELSYKLTLTAPLSTHQNKAPQIVQLMVEYETLRLRKAKNNMNYYEEFVLIGWYVMGSKKSLEDKAIQELNKAFGDRGAPYSLFYLVGSDPEAGDPQVFKSGKEIKFKFEIDPLQKYCADALNMQGSKQESAINKTLNKELHLIGIYNDKLEKLSNLLQTTKSEEKKRQIMQILDVYDRIQFNNKRQKEKTVEALNYSVLTGMILTHSSH